MRASLTGILVNFIFKNDTNKLIYKTERDSDLEKEFMIRRVEGGGKSVRAFGTDVFTLLYFRWITNKGLRCSPGNSA